MLKNGMPVVTGIHEKQPPWPPRISSGISKKKIYFSSILEKTDAFSDFRRSNARCIKKPAMNMGTKGFCGKPPGLPFAKG
jgi:hypothetical protein